MASSMRLTSDWCRWISENLTRGCDPQALVADMVRCDFSLATASAAVFDLLDQQASVLPDTSYVYETARLPSGTLIAAADRDVRVVMRLEKPVIAFLDNVLDVDECDELVRRAMDKLQRSTIVDPATGTYEVIPDRSSDGTFFALNADPFIARLDQRIAALMNWPVENGEGLQILRYRTGGQYTPHFDYFPPNDPGSKKHMAHGGQRVSSLIIYLNNVEDGGSTVFPELNLKVGPKKGAAVYFEYCNSRGQIDPLTLHGGMPVLKGEKWIATKWMRQGPYGETAARASR
jgi:prolyl 4-hydroxylase